MSGFNVELINSFTSTPQSIRDGSAAGVGKGSERKSEEGEVTFGDLLVDKINEANSVISTADNAVSNLVAGRTKNVHETMIALEKADISFKMLMQVRNKMIDAYQEIMRMQV